jgi:hypothetical protein
MRRHAEGGAAGGVRGEPVEVGGEAAHRRVALLGMGAEHLVMIGPARAHVVERLEHGAGAAGVGDRRDAAGPHPADALARGLEERLVAARGLDGDHPEDPVKERVGLDHSREAGELEVGVAVDQAWQQGRAGKVDLEGIVGTRHHRIGPDGADPAGSVHQHRAGANRVPRDRQEPIRGEALHQSVSPGW